MGENIEKWKKIVGKHCHKIANEKGSKKNFTNVFYFM